MMKENEHSMHDDTESDGSPYICPAPLLCIDNVRRKSRLGKRGKLTYPQFSDRINSDTDNSNTGNLLKINTELRSSNFITSGKVTEKSNSFRIFGAQKHALVPTDRLINTDNDNEINTDNDNDINTNDNSNTDNLMQIDTELFSCNFVTPPKFAEKGNSPFVFGASNNALLPTDRLISTDNNNSNTDNPMKINTKLCPINITTPAEVNCYSIFGASNNAAVQTSRPIKTDNDYSSINNLRKTNTELRSSNFITPAKGNCYSIFSASNNATLQTSRAINTDNDYSSISNLRKPNTELRSSNFITPAKGNCYSIFGASNNVSASIGRPVSTDNDNNTANPMKINTELCSSDLITPAKVSGYSIFSASNNGSVPTSQPINTDNDYSNTDNPMKINTEPRPINIITPAKVNCYSIFGASNNAPLQTSRPINTDNDFSSINNLRKTNTELRSSNFITPAKGNCYSIFGASNNVSTSIGRPVSTNNNNNNNNNNTDNPMKINTELCSSDFITPAKVSGYSIFSASNNGSVPTSQPINTDNDNSNPDNQRKINTELRSSNFIIPAKVPEKENGSTICASNDVSVPIGRPNIMKINTEPRLSNLITPAKVSKKTNCSTIIGTANNLSVPIGRAIPTNLNIEDNKENINIQANGSKENNPSLEYGKERLEKIVPSNLHVVNTIPKEICVDSVLPNKIPESDNCEKIKNSDSSIIIQKDFEFARPTLIENRQPPPSKYEYVTVKGVSYQKLSLLGKGGSSKVYQVLHPKDGKLLAVKKVNLTDVDPPIAEGYRNEVDVLVKLQHCDCVIKMFDYEEVGKKLYVVMEKGDTDLSSLIRSVNSTTKVSMSMIIYYWTEMLTAVNEIHKAEIIHSDLKPANFLLVSGRLKLIDFGIASAIVGDMTSVCKDYVTGTFNYMSPEALRNTTSSTGKTGFKITYKSDVWSLGCILYNLIYGYTPFQHYKNQWEKLNKIKDEKENVRFPNKDIPSILMHALKWCLQKDPTKRPAVSELLQLPYYTEQQSSKDKISQINYLEEDLPPILVNALKPSFQTNLSKSPTISQLLKEAYIVGISTAPPIPQMDSILYEVLHNAIKEPSLCQSVLQKYLERRKEVLSND